jgi:hypothetical protein
MQYPFSCVPRVIDALESALAPARLARYMAAAEGDKNLALRLYIWNARLCEAFYLPTQFAEVVARNAVHKPVLKRFGPFWHTGNRFKNLLPGRLQDELERVVREERQSHGKDLSVDQVVAGLSFGFWLYLLTSRYQHHLWENGLRHSFPNLPKKVGLRELHSQIDKLRKFRNKVAHHNAIFDRAPMAEYQNTLEVIGWVCEDTKWLAKELSNVASVISRRPRLNWA